ncbi:MAG: 30S ribosomal protein S2 [Myxococcales bacterium]|jgi:small subunit ribosomal protein S2|nr:30S ribosomal protein S2 [Myxococcales bacterium]
MSETTSEVENQELSPDNPEAPITMRQLLEAGVHFGHQTKRWNPKMKPYIFGARNGIHIIDLQHTVRLFNRAFNFIVNTISSGGTLLFVGTKKQAQEVMQQEALRAGQYHVTNRWLGGTLTNFRTVKGSIDRLRALEKMAEDGTLERLSKKEVLMKMRERDKLEKALGGIKNLTDVPSAIYVIDAKKEHIAISEARKLEIPVIAIADTNADPDVIDYVIPGNDDAIRAIKLFTAKIADACIVGARLGREKAAAQTRDDGSHGGERKQAAPGAPSPRVEMRKNRGGAMRGTPAAAATPTSVMLSSEEE